MGGDYVRQALVMSEVGGSHLERDTTPFRDLSLPDLDLHLLRNPRTLKKKLENTV